MAEYQLRLRSIDQTGALPMNRTYTVSVQCLAVLVAIFAALFSPAAVWAQPYTIAMLPDTQHYTDIVDNRSIFSAQTEWVVDNLTNENIVFLTLVGDVVENNAVGADRNLDEWLVADGAIDILDGDLNANPNGHLPYAIVIGNHDYDVPNNNRDSADRFVEFFGEERYAGRSWYGGASPNQLNHYQFFEGDGQTLMHVALEWSPPDHAIEWAQDLLSQFPDTPTIISTHAYQTRTGVPPGSGVEFTNSGDEIFEKVVRPYPNVFMVLNGHTLGERHQISTNAAGLPVYEMLADYQGRPNGGNGWLRLIKFNHEANQIDITTYSPTLDQFETDADSQFTFDVNLLDRFQNSGRITRRFRQGQDNGFGEYAGTVDTHIGNGKAGVTLPDADSSMVDTVRVEGRNDNEQALLRFDDIVGSGPGQIPAGTQILEATLTLTTEGSRSNTRRGATLHRMLAPWNATDTWNDWGDGSTPHNDTPGIQADGAESDSAIELSTGFVSRGTRSFDVTSSVQAWANGETNLGWLLMPVTDTDSWLFRSSEFEVVSERPMLTVTLVPEPSGLMVVAVAGLVGLLMSERNRVAPVASC